jgi:hypothetical protein
VMLCAACYCQQHARDHACILLGWRGCSWVHSSTNRCELEEGKQWPLPPTPCGIIAGTRSFSLKHPVSVMTKTCRFFSGAALA